MTKFVVRQLRATRARALVLGLGLLIACAGFSVLDSVGVSNAVAVRGTLNRNFQPAYDILVRPRGSRTPLERSAGLVDAGFLSDLYDGISLRQWHGILRLAGVSVAAPVVNVGYSLQPVITTINLRPVVGSEAQQIFRIVPTWSVHDGLASYPSPSKYLFYSSDKWVQAVNNQSGTPSLVVARHGVLAACPNWVHSVALRNPFLSVYALKPQETLSCAGPRQDVRGTRYNIDAPGNEAVQVVYEVPVLVAAIDPVQEAKLVGLPTAMVHGAYLREGQGLSRPIVYNSFGGKKFADRRMPLIAASRSFADEVLSVRVQRLRIVGPAAALPERMASAGVGDYLDRLTGPTVINRTFSPSTLYRDNLANSRHSYNVGNYLTTGPVRYRVLGRRELTPLTVTNPQSVWQPITGTTESGNEPASPGANAIQFRRLTPYDVQGTFKTIANGWQLTAAPGATVQGTFDPERLRGFAPLSQVPLGTFFPPAVTGATTAARARLGDRPLGPTTNLGGYLSQPPLVLTTLNAAATFFNRAVYTGHHPRGTPIAAVQVRVSRIHGASQASIARIDQVAGEIYRATHLQVDVTAGSSPTPVRIDLPAGGFGQPPLAVQQGWVKKGVATVILSAANAKDSTLFVLILVVAVLFVANAASAAVRQRRREIATLATFGWGRRQIFTAVLGELTVIGLLAGVAGTVIAAIAILIAGLHFSVAHVLEVIPAAVLVALVAGAVPAWRAARLSPMAGLAPPVRTRAAHHRVRSIRGLAWVNLTRLPGRAVLGGLGLVVGVGALAFLLGIQHAFSGAVAGDVLGNHIDVQVHGSDYAAVALILVLSVGSVADVLIMNLRERSGELATLTATGWAQISLRRLILTEGLTIGVLGALLGAAVGVAGAGLLGAEVTRILPTTAGAFLLGVAVCALAALPALAILARQAPAAMLAAE